MTEASDPAPRSEPVLPDATRILRALQRAVQEALARHKQAGHPVAVWRRGRVEWVPASEIPAPGAATPAGRD
jgi:hypothetical protein